MRLSLLRFILLATVSSNLFGTEQRIYAPDIYPSITRDGEGIYLEILNEIVERSGVSVNTQIVPFARAIALYERDEESCFFPGSADSARDYLGKDYIDAEAFNIFKIVLAFPKQGQLSSLEQLKNKRVAILRGDEVEAFGLNEADYQFERIDSIEQSIAMLKAKRVDAIMSGLHELLAYKTELQVDLDRPVYEAKESIVCHDAAGHRGFLEKVSRAIKSMKQDGTMKRILKNRYFLD